MMRSIDTTRLVLAASLAFFILTGCRGDGRSLEVRTFQLQYIEPAAANRIIEPYVFADRGSTISIDQESGLITVRETPEMLSRIEEVLKRYDQPEPSVKLHFKLIEANGGSSTDPALDEIRAALPQEVFRFRNYRLLGEAVMTGIEWSEVAQHLAESGSRYVIEGKIGEVRATGDSGTVQLQVGLISDFPPIGRVFQTAVNARLGQLLVLGSAKPAAEKGALILAVRAELERP